ncbi:acyl-CoA dehydrogenase family protein [Planktothrix mougeotii]|uniref:acyl-CoA dehydrogenase family protein n=1 Tax=Planktothrix mougeotii TaxID=54306 RepID=UPI002AD489F5|nr:acyl-CoA dehydrogenase family protein [Planktothrix mougeotii]
MSELLQQTESYLKQKIYPQANQIDECSKALNQAFKELGEDAFNSLNQELNQCRSQIFSAQNHPQTLNTSEKYKLRAWAIELAVRCAHAAITVSSGAANLNSNSAQRIYREALVFTVSGQTTELMKATLEKIKHCRVL